MESMTNTVNWVDTDNLFLDEENLRTEELAILCSIVRKLQTITDYNHVPSVFEEIKRIIPFDRAILYLYNRKHRSLRCEARYDTSDEGIRKVNETALKVHSEWVFKNRRPIIIQNGEKNESVWNECTDHLGSLFVVPILLKDRCFGTIGLESSQKHAFGQRETYFLTLLVNQVAIILENIYLSAKIKTSKKKYQNLFEKSQLPIYFITLNGRLLEANKAIVSLLGYQTKKEALASNLINHIILKKDRQTFRRVIAKRGNHKNFEAQLKRNDGAIITVSITGTAVRDRDERIIGYTGFLRDITEERKLEEQLFQAQKMQSIGALVGEITHDFNNLLSGIIGYASLILDDLPRTNPYRADIQTILDASKKAASLTSRLLSFSRKEKLQIKPISINEVILEVLNIISSTIGKSIKIKSQLSPDISTVHADANRIQQALMNLCINARDAMPCGGDLTVETENMTLDKKYTKKDKNVKSSSYVLIRISDTGVGMDANTIDKIFEPHFTTKETKKGSGLGLTIVNRIVENHRGTISVTSELGKGTTFEILLPAIDKEPEISTT